MKLRPVNSSNLARLAERWIRNSAEPWGSRRTSHTVQSVCDSCRRSIQRRQYASAAAAVAEDSQPASQPPPAPSEDQPPTPRPAYQLKAGIVLSRPPMLTRELTPFEKAFYLYQKRLNERLVLPFTRYFYYQKGTPGEEEWKRKVKQRLTPARDIGRYDAYGPEKWNDEVLIGSSEGEIEHQVEALLDDAEAPSATAVETEGKEGETPRAAGGNIGAGSDMATREAIERPHPRLTEADRTNNQKSLDRVLQRTVYLLVQNEAGRWQFPSARIVGRESLRQAGERVIVEAAGLNMNTWIVGNNPIGHYVSHFSEPADNSEQGLIELGEKVFFLKGRILAGQASLKDTKHGLKDYRWLTKEEIKDLVHPKYWSMTQDMLVER